jgi:hypothetical protein
MFAINMNTPHLISAVELRTAPDQQMEISHNLPGRGGILLGWKLGH